MLSYRCYDNKEDFLVDFQLTKKQHPEFPSEERALEIYNAIVEEFENKDIITPEIFEDHIIFKLALGIDYRTFNGLNQIDKIKSCETALTKEQLFLVLIPVKAILINPMMMSKYKSKQTLTYWATAKVYAKWILNAILEFKYTKLPDGRYDHQNRTENAKTFSEYLYYLEAILAPERNGGLDALFLEREMQGK